MIRRILPVLVVAVVSAGCYPLTPPRMVDSNNCDASGCGSIIPPATLPADLDANGCDANGCLPGVTVPPTTADPCVVDANGGPSADCPKP